MSKVTRYKDFSSFANDSGLIPSVSNFEFFGYFSRHRSLLQSGNGKLLRFRDETGSFFFCMIDNTNGTDVAIINRGGTPKTLNRAIAEFKKKQDVYILADQETITTIGSRSDIELTVYSEYDLLLVDAKKQMSVLTNSNIEVATIQDFEELVKLSRLCYSDQYPKRNRTIDVFQHHVEDKVSKGEFYIIRANEVVSSFCEIDLQRPDILIISNLYTTPQFRNQGLSSALVSRVLNDFLASDSKIVAMKINVSNKSSHSVARRNGFVKITTNSFGIVNPTEKSKAFLDMMTA